MCYSLPLMINYWKYLVPHINIFFRPSLNLSLSWFSWPLLTYTLQLIVIALTKISLEARAAIRPRGPVAQETYFAHFKLWVLSVISESSSSFMLKCIFAATVHGNVSKSNDLSPIWYTSPCPRGYAGTSGFAGKSQFAHFSRPWIFYSSQFST